MLTYDSFSLGSSMMRFLFSLMLSVSFSCFADSGPFSVESAIYRIEVPSVDGRHSSLGTGVLIAQNKILTNCHVLADMGGSPRLFHRQSGRQFYATSYYGLGNNDACVLVGGFEGVPVRINGDFRAGESVWVFGYPRAVPVVIQGVVKGIEDSASGGSLVVTAFCSPGSSGGPVVNVRGELVGLQWGMVQYQDHQCLAIPASRLLPYLSSR